MFLLSLSTKNKITKIQWFKWLQFLSISYQNFICRSTLFPMKNTPSWPLFCLPFWNLNSFINKTNLFYYIKHMICLNFVYGKHTRYSSIINENKRHFYTHYWAWMKYKRKTQNDESIRDYQSKWYSFINKKQQKKQKKRNSKDKQKDT